MWATLKGPFAENRADLLLYEEHAYRCWKPIVNSYDPGLGTVTIDPKIDQLSEKTGPEVEKFF